MLSSYYFTSSANAILETPPPPGSALSQGRITQYIIRGRFACLERGDGERSYVFRNAYFASTTYAFGSMIISRTAFSKVQDFDRGTIVGLKGEFRNSPIHNVYKPIGYDVYVYIARVCECVYCV